MTSWQKKLFYFLISKLPTPVRHSFYRKSYARIPEFMPPGLTFELAYTKEDLEAAFMLLHDTYVEQGFITPQPSRMRLIVQHALPTTSLLVAKVNDRVIGTISVMRDTPLGLPMEKVFDITHLKLRGKRVAELSCLAIHPDFRRSMGGQIFFPLTLFAALYAKNSFGTDYLVWNLYPHHADFYNAIFGSSKLIGQDNIIKDYLGAPAAGIQLDLAAVENFAKQKYGHLEKERNLYEYTFITKHSCFHFPAKDIGVINHPVMSPEMFNYFFVVKTNLFHNMSQLEEQVIARYYPLTSYAKVIPVAKFKTQKVRDCQRWDVRLIGLCHLSDGRKIKLEVLDCSLSGFKAYLFESISTAETFMFEVTLAEGEVATLEGRASWKTADNIYGFRITFSTSEWTRLVETQANTLKKISA